MKQDVLNPLTWSKDQWIDAFQALVLATFAFAMTFFIITVFH